MPIDVGEILSILDRCCDAFTFPMLDNGYVYLAATRLSLYRSHADWAMVIEVFGFSPRAGMPDTHIHTFASRLYNRDGPADYMNRHAYENYLARNPNNDSRFIFPIDGGPWQDAEEPEFVAADAREVVVRKQARTYLDALRGRICTNDKSIVTNGHCDPLCLPAELDLENRSGCNQRCQEPSARFCY
jgi:hypothetical protein